ncbi:putative ABC transporter permease [Intestinimonas massiliensis]|uniref:ABC transporter permease n=1 Tax=Intestinimonas massiliensis (ex Afouda et al. 2020) TaxID=1673721 RepID=A0AAW5JPM7_9FIRM|nr:putative ABC transporter permease [Intestinimonas massiliensis (ex Afouda et al. 2020)]MCQ4769854.1 putative ABC transporter permease [Intestinimonas massiliensis (ex Afouda et al. 2020)]
MAAWFWYFVLYSFLGFLVEVVFARITHNPKRDRKCLYFLPLCPVYGLGVLLMLALPAARSNPWLLFLWAALSATGAEYLMDLFYDRVLGVSFWDYSHLPLNLHGRVCLLFSFFWGILGLIAVRLVHPLVVELVSHIPQAVTLPAALFLALDIGFSVFVLRRDGTTDALMWYRRLPARGTRHSLPEK